MHSSRVADWSVKGKRNPANEHPAMKFTIVIPDWEEVPLLRKTGFQDDAGPTEEGRGEEARGGEKSGGETASPSKRLRPIAAGFRSIFSPGLTKTLPPPPLLPSLAHFITQPRI